MLQAQAASSRALLHDRHHTLTNSAARPMLYQPENGGRQPSRSSVSDLLAPARSRTIVRPLRHKRYCDELGKPSNGQVLLLTRTYLLFTDPLRGSASAFRASNRAAAGQWTPGNMIAALPRCETRPTGMEKARSVCLVPLGV